MANASRQDREKSSLGRGVGRNDWILAAMGLLALSLFLRTAPPTVTVGDAGELLAASDRLAAAHPPGYPLWIFISRLFRFVPLGPHAWRAGLVSQLSVAGALLLLGRRLANSVPGEAAFLSCLAAGALLLGSRRVFLAGIEIEVYGLHLLCLAALVCLAFGRRRLRLDLWFLVFGCALSNHYLSLAALPLLGAFLGGGKPSLLARVRRAPRFAALLLLGWVPYLLLPIRAEVSVLPGWTAHGTFHGFLDTVRRSVYAHPEGTRPLGTLLCQQALYLKSLCGGFFLPIALLAVFGCWFLLKRRLQHGLPLLLVFLLTGPVLVWWSNLPLEEQSQQILEPFHSSSALLLCFLAAIGVPALCKRRVRLGTGVLLLFLSLGLALNLPRLSLRGDYGGLAFMEFLSRGLPRRCGLWSASDQTTFLANYMIGVEGRQGQRTVVSQRLPYWPTLLSEGSPPLPLPPLQSLIAFQKGLGKTARQTDLSQWVQLRSYELGSDVPLFWEAHASSSHLWPLLQPEGILLAAARDEGAFSEELKDWLPVGCPQAKETARFLSGLYANLGAYHATRGRADQAMRVWRTAVAIDPLSPTPWSNQGTILSRKGRFSEAKEMFRQALRLDPYHHDAAVNLAIVLLTQDRLEEAEGWAILAKRSNPNRQEAEKVLERVRASLSAFQ